MIWIFVVGVLSILSSDSFLKPASQDARALFEPFLPCNDVQLRRVYLRLALKYHPDKHPKAFFWWEESTWMFAGFFVGNNLRLKRCQSWNAVTLKLT